MVTIQYNAMDIEGFDIDIIMDIFHSSLLSKRESGVMALITDLEGNITHHCVSAPRLTGYKEDLKGRNIINDLVAPQYRDYFLSQHPSKTLQQYEIALEALGLVTKDKKLLYCRAIVFQLRRFTTNEHRGYFYWLRDVTHLHHQKDLMPPKDLVKSEYGDAQLKLTPSEWRVFKCAAQGMSLKETADDMGISPGTVSTHRRNIKKKIGPSVKDLRFRQIVQRYNSLLH